MTPSSRLPHAVKNRQGFSLIELLVSVAVAFILVAALMQSMVSSLDSWTNQEKVFSSQREGRAALRVLADDLASIVIMPGDGPLAEDPQAMTGRKPLRFLVQKGPPTSPTTTRLAFLRSVKRATKGTDSGRGDLQLVLYGIALTPDGGASGAETDANSQKLLRREYSAAETFRRLEGHRVGGQPLIFEEDWQQLENLAEADNQAATTGVRNAVLAHDVIRFECKPLENMMPNPPVAQEWPSDQMPKWVEVTLRVTNRQTGRLLKTAEDWRGEGVRSTAISNGTPDVYEDDAEVRTFSMRLRLPSLSL